MRAVRLTPRARKDLAAIRRYTVAHWGRAQATDYLRGLGTVFVALADGGLAGSSADDLRPDYRRARFGSHVIFFRADEGTVRIIRVLHERMDFAAHL